MSKIIAVTGATGNVGRNICERLLAKGINVRAIARNKEKLQLLNLKGAETYSGDIQNSAFLSDVFQGADAVFAMLPEHPELPEFLEDKRRSAISIIEAIKSAKVEQVIALSAIGVDPPSGIGPSAANGEFETMLKEIPGLSVVVLRAAFLMENLLASLQLIKNNGINGGAIKGDIAIPMIAAKDISEMAVKYLTKSAPRGYVVHPLLGPRDFTYREATLIIGQAIGKPDLTYVEFSYEDFYRNIVASGVSKDAANSIIELFTAINEGKLQNKVKRSEIYSTPTTLEEFVQEVLIKFYTAS